MNNSNIKSTYKKEWKALIEDMERLDSMIIDYINTKNDKNINEIKSLYKELKNRSKELNRIIHLGVNQTKEMLEDGLYMQFASNLTGVVGSGFDSYSNSSVNTKMLNSLNDAQDKLIRGLENYPTDVLDY